MRASRPLRVSSIIVASLSLAGCLPPVDVATDTPDASEPVGGGGESRAGGSGGGSGRGGAEAGAGGSTSPGTGGAGGQPAREVDGGDPTAVLEPLALVDVQPPLGAAGVAPGSPIVLTFSSDIDPASAAVIIELSRTGSLPIGGTIDVQGPSVRFLPAEPLILSNSYAWRYDGSLRSTAGAEWAGRAEASFQTREGRWGEPENLGSGGDNPRIAVDAAGNALAIWNEVGVLESGAASLGVARFELGAGWERLPTPASCGPQCTPSVVAGGANGTFEVAWFATSSLEVSRYDASTGFAAPTRMEVRSGPPGADGVISGGQLWLAANLAQGISVVRTSDGSTWLPPLGAYVSDARSSNAGPVLVVDGPERARVFWVESPQLLASTFSDGSWSSPQFVPNFRGDFSPIGFAGAGAPAGNALLAWEEDRPSAEEPIVTTSTLGVVLMAPNGSVRDEDPPPLPDDVGGNPASPSVAMNARGEALLAWRQSAGDPTDPAAPSILWGAFHGATATDWSAPVQLSDDIDGLARPPAVAIDPSGNAHVLWVSADGANGADVLVKRYHRDGGIFDYTGLINASATVDAALTRGRRSGNDNCQLAGDAQGRAIAIWAAPDGGIWAVRFE
jgi:Big-like domain-containing protein